ncbi:aklavinone 12-hydroxylase [Kibdelosporangium banguiense]|uniref:Aklavinone 12-hydroxylase n=1 Tax=Kibdelosporangium banguiense TaxID=1365924 RepID=A0ABS4TES8_9PSEU|nr:FAD-dependent oxidoreductase [Kibdelosporangium banguiense]MBP2322938.1 aklavinone 12-hydroxylase [Kibdelosporangium banguiense]
MAEALVLIVGAGLGGTSTAMFLAKRGVDVTVVERHESTSIHPRASGQYPRTMEFLRIAGVDEQIKAVAEDTGLKMRVAETVRGPIHQTIIGNLDELKSAVEKVTPAGWGSASQDQAEPIMMAQAENHGARFRFGTELVSFKQDTDGVTAQLLERDTGRTDEVRAQYLIAADGNRSRVREKLGIPRFGKGRLANHIGMVFNADLSELLTDKDMWLYYLQNKDFTGAFVTTSVPGRHIFSVEYHPENGESFADYPVERCAELIRAGLAMPDLQPDIVWRGPWEMAARIAERWRDNRVFLVGDAAKVTPPTGGLGGNAAVCDGFDIAWKLAAVLNGEAGPGLLDTYEAERKHSARIVVGESLFNYVQRMAPHLAGDDIPASVGAVEAMLGERRHSSAVIDENDDGSPVKNPLELQGEPGFRAPHVILPSGLSTLDLWSTGWVLLTGPDGRWQEVTNLPVHDLGEHTERFGISAHGASLIRPDGIVAWRTSEQADKETLENVLRRVLSC